MIDAEPSRGSQLFGIENKIEENYKYDSKCFGDGMHRLDTKKTKKMSKYWDWPYDAYMHPTVSSHGTFEQYTLLDRLSDAAKAQTKPSDDAMIIDEPAKPVAGSSKHPDNTDVIDSELIY